MEQVLVKKVVAREVLDGLANPTIQVDVLTQHKVLGRSTVPSGMSVGIHEVLELRDGGRRYNGKGVLKAVENVNTIIAPKLIGKDATKQKEIDDLLKKLDGTENKSKLGGNSTLGVSLAVAKAAANELGVPLYRHIQGLMSDTNLGNLPVPMVNILNGGHHSSNDLDFQEHIVMPTRAKSFSDGLRLCVEVFHELGKVLLKKYGKQGMNMGLVGGFAPPIKDVREALDRIVESAKEIGYEHETELGLDAAASHLYDIKKGKYKIMEKYLDKHELIDFYKSLISKYPLHFIEDPLEQNDFEGFAEITKRLDVQIVGDDFFATNIKRLKKAVETKAADALLLKVNQIGTLSETLDTAKFANSKGYSVIVSGRAGDTVDTIISDIAVAVNAEGIKGGSVARSEKNSKYNRLLQIEEELG